MTFGFFPDESCFAEHRGNRTRSPGRCGDSVREKAAVTYEELIGTFTTAFIPFDEAWDNVLRLVSQLTIPD